MSEDARFEPSEPLPVYAEGQHVARIQPFSGGGFEGHCYWRSRDAYRQNPLGMTKLVPTPRSKEDVAQDKAQRAKKRVRQLAREVAADHLCTFTTREVKNDPYKLLDRFGRFVELYRKATGTSLVYVAVPEPHPTNPDHWHVHAAVHGRIRVNVARGIWWSLCGGRGQGNIDAKWIKCRSGVDRAAKVARYISKYISKSFAVHAELSGRHRYRSSRITLQQRRILVLEAGSCLEALDRLLDRLNLTRGDLQVFFFPDFSGFWFSCNGDIAERPPPF